MQKKPELKTHSDAIQGMKRHPAFSSEPINATSSVSHPADLPAGFGIKYFATDASKSEAPEVAALRDKAGFHTRGSRDQISYPAGGDLHRIVKVQPTPTHNGPSGAWGASIGQRTHIEDPQAVPVRKDRASKKED
jgi:hypothetical protein